MCLGLALLWGRPQVGPEATAGRVARYGSHPVLAGLVLGIDAAMKATAWPALVIGVALLVVRDGKRATLQFTATALAACAVLIGPVAVLWPSALAENTISFPLGLSKSTSPAASPLPGHLLAQTGHLGHLAAVGLLALAGLGIAVSLLVAPPRDVPAATWRLFLGLVLMFTLAPATRFGYYIYPAGLLVWMLIALAGRHRIAAEPARPTAAAST
jgi:hypothetical protein